MEGGKECESLEREEVLGREADENNKLIMLATTTQCCINVIDLYSPNRPAIQGGYYVAPNNY